MKCPLFDRCGGSALSWCVSGGGRYSSGVKCGNLVVFGEDVGRGGLQIKPVEIVSIGREQLQFKPVGIVSVSFRRLEKK